MSGSGREALAAMELEAGEIRMVLRSYVRNRVLESGLLVRAGVRP